MTWRKRLSLFSVGLLVALLAIGGFAWKMHRSRPEFYRPYTWTTPQRGVLAHKALDKLATVHNAFATQSNNAMRMARMSGSTIPATLPAEPFSIKLTEEELNALLMHMADIYHWNGKYEDFVTDPGVYFDDGRIIVAGSVVELGTVMSLVFEPRLDANGKLRMDLAHIMSGRLPVPRIMLNGQIEKLTTVLEKNLPAWERKAKMDPQGRANGAAAAAAMTKMLLHSLDGTPSDPLIFLPTEDKDYAALKVTALEVKGNTLSLTMQLVNPGEQATYLAGIKADKTTGAGQ